MASLRELQQSFAGALRDPARLCAVDPAVNLDIYRNNSANNFETALAVEFPVLRQRVGDDYFRQLAHHFRGRAPSRSGDLHWIGSGFAQFLDEHLSGGDYVWLADLARLEWARQESSVCMELVALGVDALAAIAPGDLEHLVITLQPSLRIVRSAFPVFSVWMANQDENAPPVSQSAGSEQGMVRIRSESLEVQPLPVDLALFLYGLAAGRPLGEAVSAAGVDEARLTAVLGFAFNEGLVVSLATPH